VLVGRDVPHKAMMGQLDDAAAGRGHQPVLLFGERGMGKTVLLDRAVNEARGRGWAALRVEAQEHVPLSVVLASRLADLYSQLPGRPGRLPQWLREFKVTFGARVVGAEVHVARRGDGGAGPPPGTYESLAEVAKRAKGPGRGVLVAVDELHQADMAEVRELGRLAQAANSEGWHFVLTAAGLAEIRDRIVDEAPTYATRFAFHSISSLSPDEVRAAFVVPLNDAGRLVEPAALDELVRHADGYPYFVQLYGRHVWEAAEGERINLADVRAAHSAVMSELDAGPYGAGWGRLRPSERRFLSAMAAAEGSPVGLADVLGRLGMSAKSASPLRERVISSGLVQPAGHGLLSFVWPGYREYVRSRHPLAEADGRGN
jgi:hypothetical protein